MTIETCYSPIQYPLFHNSNAIVVVIDVLRATSAIVTALANGAAGMIPVAGVETAKEWQNKGFLAAAERNGIKLDGFDFGNSPLSYLVSDIKDKSIVISTTNGTQAIEAAKEAKQVVIASFLNAQAVANYLIQQQQDVIFLCSGWKNKFNLEDSLLAGYISELISQNGFTSNCDSTIAAKILYNQTGGNLFDFLAQSSHRNRLSHLNLEEDIQFCLKHNVYNVVPVLNTEGYLTL
jgi:2-phosphosulfolactate phosphatase